MSIVKTVELAREFDITNNGDRVAKRTWVCVLSDDTLQDNPPTAAEVLSATGITVWGAVHPEFTSMRFKKYVITERFGDSPYHVQMVGEYGLVTDDETLTPTARAAKWSFESQPGQVPALFYYSGSGNNTKYPLTNSAYDYFEGLTTEESLVRATMQKNYAAFPTAQMAATNSINASEYFGGAAYTWKVAGVNSTYVVAFHNWTPVSYWDTTCELTYRQTGWVLQLPDVGWNFLNGGVKQRAMVFDEKNGEWVASANPVGLLNGSLTLGRPDILQRRVNPETNFTSLFGTPPD